VVGRGGKGLFKRGCFFPPFQAWQPPEECSWGKGDTSGARGTGRATVMAASHGPSATAGCWPALSPSPSPSTSPSPCRAAAAAQPLPQSRRAPCLQMGRWQSGWPQAAQQAGVRAGDKTALLPVPGWERE